MLRVLISLVFGSIVSVGLHAAVTIQDVIALLDRSTILN